MKETFKTTDNSPKNSLNLIISKGQTIFKAIYIEEPLERFIILENDLELLYLR